MPAGYSTRCKVCNHPRRAEIERWVIEEKLSYREVSRRLEGAISREAIRRHFDEHFNVKQEAALQYQESQARLEQAAAKRVDQIRLLDEQMAEAAELRAAYAAWLKRCAGEGQRPPQAVVQAYAAAAGEVRQSAKTKQELLGDDAESKKADALQTLVDLLMLADGDDDPGTSGQGDS